MKAIIIAVPGGPEVLKLVQYPDPVLAEGQVLIKVKAAGINRPDIFQRKGNYPAPAGAPQDIPGLEVAGVIEESGSHSTRWKKGDRVCALVGGGGYASLVAVNENHCLPIPSDFNFIEAAALPECLFTVWHNVFQRGNLKQGESLLVHGGSGGIGSFAIKLASALGSDVYATASSDLKCHKCLEWGAKTCFNHHNEDFATALKPIGVDVILDSVGGDYIAKNLSILKPDGRLIFINAVSGANGDFNVFELMHKRITITGSTLRARSAEFKSALAADVEKHVWPL
ncbi:MAG: zinc-binding dehydrogenase, partial [Bacteroidetes bacterium]